ncbi:MAG: metallophosphatase, partial [Mesorhizobium sp.]
MSNYPLPYKLSWLPRFVKPSLVGDARDFAPMAGTLMDPPPTRTVRLAFVGDISAVANRSAPDCDPAIKALLGAADLVIGNCESPVVDRPSAVLGTRLGTHHAMSERFLA